jgi:hypothetical protein
LNRSSVAAAALLLAASTTSGCGTIAHWIWPCPVQPPSSRLTRDTPEDAVDFLVEAFKNRNAGDLYHSLHPDFVKENGGFAQDEFQLAYEHYEADFAADAANLVDADRNIRMVRGEAVVTLSNPKTGAFFPFVLVDRPKIRIVTKNPFVPPIEDAVDMHALVRIEDGRLALPADFPLTSIANLSKETAAALKTEDILRVEFFDDWLVRRVDVDAAKGIRFMDKIKEHLGK